MSFDATYENDSKLVVLGIFGKKQVSVDLIQKIKEGMDSRLVELTAKQISNKLRMSSSNLQSSEVNFLKDSTRRHLDLKLLLPSFVQDPMHFCVIARQLFICSQIFIAPLSFYTAEKREKSKTEDEREKKNIEEREKEYNRMQISSISHPSAIGYNLYENNTNVNRNTNDREVKLNADFRPKLKRNKHVDSVWGDSKKCHPVFFENISNTYKSQIEGKLVLWNQNDFTFFYNEVKGQMKASDSKTVVDKTMKGTNVEKQRLVGEIGVGLVLMEYSIVSTEKTSSIPSSAHFIGSKGSIERDVDFFDAYSVDTAKNAFAMHVTSNDDSTTSRYSTVEGNITFQEDEDLLSGDRHTIKVSIYPTLKMNMKGISEFCLSIMYEAAKIYCIERSCLAHTIQNLVSPSHSIVQSDSLINLKKIMASDSFILVNRLNRILHNTMEESIENIGTLGHYFYELRLPKTKALNLHRRIVSTFLRQNPHFSTIMTSLYIEPTKLGFHPCNQKWCDLLRTSEQKVNVTIFSDIFEQDNNDSKLSEADIEHLDIQDLRILPEEFSNVASHLMPLHLRTKHILLEIVTTSLGVHLFHYNILQHYASSLKKIIETVIKLTKQPHNNPLRNVYLGLDIPLRQEQRQFELNYGSGSEDRAESNPLSWTSSRLYRLLPREVAQLKTIPVTISFSKVHSAAWRRGFHVSSNTILIPKIPNALGVFKEKIITMCRNLVDVDVVPSVDSVTIIRMIPFSSSINTFEIQLPSSDGFVEVTHRISDLADIFRGPNQTLSSEHPDHHYYDQRGIGNNKYNFDVSTHRHFCKNSITETSYFSSIFEDQVTKSICQHLASIPFSMFYDNMLIERRVHDEKPSSKVTHFQNLIRSLAASRYDFMHWKWTEISLENVEDLLDKKFRAATPFEISCLLEQNDLENHIFLLNNEDTVEDQQKIIMVGCLYKGTEPNPHIQNQPRIKGFAFFRSDFKQLNVLSILFQDFHSNNVLNVKDETENVNVLKGTLPHEFDIHSISDPLVHMAKELQRVLVNGLNNISIRKYWVSLKGGLTCADDHEMFVTIDSSKRIKLEFLKFIEPVLNLVSPTIQDFLILLRHLEDVNLWSSTAKEESEESTEYVQRTHVLVVDTKCQQLMGLYFILDLDSDQNITLNAELVHYPAAYFNVDDMILAQKTLIEKFVNFLLCFSFVD